VTSCKPVSFSRGTLLHGVSKTKNEKENLSCSRVYRKSSGVEVICFCRINVPFRARSVVFTGTSEILEMPSVGEHFGRTVSVWYLYMYV
jgi:hypothetical protein